LPPITGLKRGRTPLAENLATAKRGRGRPRKAQVQGADDSAVLASTAVVASPGSSFISEDPPVLG
jgi:hypothetical protein